MAKSTSIIDPLGDDNVVINYRYTISSYGADYPVDAIVKRVVNKDIFVPHFQRDFVWTAKQSSKFIESLLLGFPVPGIFLAKDTSSPRLSVLDGLQRLRTLEFFYNGYFARSERKFRLSGVQEEFNGLTYADLSDEDRVRLDNFIIHATIVKQDEPTDDISSIYYLFERINTGGTQLAPQEIRTCLSFGPFVSLIQELNLNDEWRDIFGPLNRRMRDQEMILRFFGMLYSRSKYKRPMKSFLNMTLGHNRDLGRISKQQLHDDFIHAITLVHKSVGSKAFRPQRAFNAAVFDSVMVGIATSQRKNDKLTPAKVKRSYDKLLKNRSYMISVTKATADEDAVKHRMKLAIEAFA